MIWIVLLTVVAGVLLVGVYVDAAVESLQRRRYREEERFRRALIDREYAERFREIGLTNEQRAVENAKRADYVTRTLFPEISGHQ